MKFKFFNSVFILTQIYSCTHDSMSFDAKTRSKGERYANIHKKKKQEEVNKTKLITKTTKLNYQPQRSAKRKSPSYTFPLRGSKYRDVKKIYDLITELFNYTKEPNEAIKSSMANRELFQDHPDLVPYLSNFEKDTLIKQFISPFSGSACLETYFSQNGWGVAMNDLSDFLIYLVKFLYYHPHNEENSHLYETLEKKLTETFNSCLQEYYTSEKNNKYKDKKRDQPLVTRIIKNKLDNIFGSDIPIESNNTDAVSLILLLLNFSRYNSGSFDDTKKINFYANLEEIERNTRIKSLFSNFLEKKNKFSNKKVTFSSQNYKDFIETQIAKYPDKKVIYFLDPPYPKSNGDKLLPPDTYSSLKSSTSKKEKIKNPCRMETILDNVNNITKNGNLCLLTYPVGFKYRINEYFKKQDKNIRCIEIPLKREYAKKTKHKKKKTTESIYLFYSKY